MPPGQWIKLHEQGAISRNELTRRLSAIPSIEKENKFLWDIYNKVRNQVIVAGMGEPIGINYLAVKFVFECYGIRNDNDEWLDLLEDIEWIYQEESRILRKFKPAKP